MAILSRIILSAKILVACLFGAVTLQADVFDVLDECQITCSTRCQEFAGRLEAAIDGFRNTCAEEETICESLGQGYFIPRTGNISHGRCGVAGVDSCRALISGKTNGMICASLCNDFFIPTRFTDNASLGLAGVSSQEACQNLLDQSTRTKICTHMGGEFYIPVDISTGQTIGRQGTSLEDCIASIQ